MSECHVQPKEAIQAEFEAWKAENESETSSQYWERTSPERVLEEHRKRVEKEVQSTASTVLKSTIAGLRRLQ